MEKRLIILIFYIYNFKGDLAHLIVKKSQFYDYGSYIN